MITEKRTELSIFKAWATKFTIKKGKHRNNRWWSFKLTKKDCVAFQFSFDENCLNTLKGNDKYDINKLAGFSDAWHHHKSSGRLGWRCVDGENIELVTYTNDDWSRAIADDEVMMSIKPNEICSCEIEDLGNDWKFILCNFNRQSLMTRLIPKKNNKGIGTSNRKWYFMRYYLYPYFGGNKPAPRTMNIWLEFIS